MKDIQRYTFNNVYAIFTSGGGVHTTELADGNLYHEHLEGEYVVHQDDNGTTWVLLFEDIDIAERVRQEYVEATGDTAQVMPTLATSIEFDHNCRLYRWDGEWEDITRENYIKRMSLGV